MTVQEVDPAQFGLPSSKLALAADALVAEVSAPLVYNHCVRAYLYTRELAAVQGLLADEDYDDELLYLSCLLHDLGATDYANGDQRFEVDGADAAGEFLRNEGVDEKRIQTGWNAVALHTSDGIAHRFGTVEALMQMGTGADIAGLRRELLPDGFADRVHRCRNRAVKAHRTAGMVSGPDHPQVSTLLVPGVVVVFPLRQFRLHRRPDQPHSVADSFEG
jgi:hypothetical protein